jgi:hypothetical protein
MYLKVLLLVLFMSHVCYSDIEEEEGVKYANRCEGNVISIATEFAKLAEVKLF